MRLFELELPLLAIYPACIVLIGLVFVIIMPVLLECTTV